MCHRCHVVFLHSFGWGPESISLLEQKASCELFTAPVWWHLYVVRRIVWEAQLRSLSLWRRQGENAQARPAQRGQSVPLTAVVFLRVWITHVVFSSRICRTYCKVIVLLSAFIPSSHIFMFATHHVSNCVLGGTVRVCIYVSLTHPHVSPSGPAGLNFWGVLSQLSERLLVFFFPCKNTR